MNAKAETFGVWDYCSNSALRRASRQLGQLYDDVLKPSGLRITQYSLLTQILFSDAPPLKVLAEMMVMDLSALGHTLKPLIREGLVELVPDGKDRRVKRAQLTDTGRKAWEETNELWRDAQARFDNAFGTAEAKAMRKAMEVVSSKDFARRFAGLPERD